jgi:magnesium transporter
MTGFFGMNFVSMSVYQWLYGFPSFLAAMVIIPLAMMWYFRSRGWLD